MKKSKISALFLAILMLISTVSIPVAGIVVIGYDITLRIADVSCQNGYFRVTSEVGNNTTYNREVLLRLVVYKDGEIVCSMNPLLIIMAREIRNEVLNVSVEPFFQNGDNIRFELSLYDNAEQQNLLTDPCIYNLTFDGGTEVTPTYYSVTFVADGNTISTQTVAKGSAAAAPDNIPQKDGYTFTGWDKDFSNITSDLTVNAVFEQAPPQEAKNITISNVTASAGETVSVSIDIDENINMAIGTLLIDYDITKLTAQSYEFGEIVSGTNALVNLNFKDTDGSSKIKASFIGTDIISAGGALLTITFKVADDVLNDTVIPVTLVDADFRNMDEIRLPLNKKDGAVTVLNYTLGDVNNDGFINILDSFRILRYDIGALTFTNNQKQAANVNKDAKINVLDSLIIQHYDLGLIDSLE